MAEFKKDKALWYEAYLDTPFATPPGGLTHDQALTTPGCYVKTRTLVPGKLILGRLVFIKDGAVLVRSNDPYHDNEGNPFVWTGSLPEYTQTWICD